MKKYTVECTHHTEHTLGCEICAWAKKHNKNISEQYQELVLVADKQAVGHEKRKEYKECEAIRELIRKFNELLYPPLTKNY